VASRARDPETGLTQLEAAFVREYLVDRSPTEAARRAGYSGNYALKHAYLLPEHPRIAAAIKAEDARLLRKARVTAEDVIEELAKLALADPRALFDADGNVKPLTQWTQAEAACVASVDVIKRNLTAGDGKMDMVYRIRMWDKPKALELLAKHFKLLTDKIELSGEIDLVARLQAARSRTVALEERVTAVRRVETEEG
jgi:phage terminase small subunit